MLLVDEAGMVGSAELAALIEAADAAQAKLVLVGDHQQLGEIEAGGLYRALAERGDPILLDEVIRHNHEVDREAARMIREGEGRAALELYRSSERVTVAPDAEARREAMVADWHRAYAEGQDALMVAKRNAEVGRLNATARELLKAEGQLGGAGDRSRRGPLRRRRSGHHPRKRPRRRDLQPRALAGGARSTPSRAGSCSRGSTRRGASRSVPTTSPARPRTERHRPSSTPTP